MSAEAQPQVGVGVIIEDETSGKVLIGRRIGSHAPYYSIPGGKLELGETFEDAAMREVGEETGLEIATPRVIAVTNNLETFRNEGVHFISVILHTTHFLGQVQVREPDKCSGWGWYYKRHLPEPHFDASRFAIRCLLDQKPFVGES